MELHIEKEFAVKIPPLTKEEFDPFEGNIGANGRPGYKKHLYQVWTMYNGKNVKAAIPIIF